MLMTENYSTILVAIDDRVATITLNRPEALNALNTTVMAEVVQTCLDLDQRSDIGCIRITGSPKAFAAGADIKEMSELDFPEIFEKDIFAMWDRLTTVRTPIIAAVSGFALGGGCELAMMCDIVVAADNAKFGQPEITLGIIPGIGGSQRLTQAVGKAKAMDLVLSGRMMDAEEAERAGLVSRVVPAESLDSETLKLATKIASMPKPAAMVAKAAVNRSFEIPLNEGLKYERHACYALFATADKKEGMQAFMDKRTPNWDR